METEYKWSADPQQLNQALLWASAHIGTQSRTIEMHSRYYDTADAQLHRRYQAALRLRQENSTSICCMKRRNVTNINGMHTHEEYECEAETIDEGLLLLPEHGAPRDLCTAARQLPLIETCAVDFKRCALLLQQDDTVCELALDEGSLRRGDRTAPLCEIELEHIAGGESGFHALAAELADHLSLAPEPRSKLARAMAL